MQKQKDKKVNRKKQNHRIMIKCKAMMNNRINHKKTIKKETQRKIKINKINKTINNKWKSNLKQICVRIDAPTISKIVDRIPFHKPNPIQYFCTSHS